VAWDHIQSSYDAVADSYEERFLGELRDKPRDRQLLDEFATQVGDPVLEVGSGPGQIGSYVTQQGRQVVGLDLSPRMAQLASGRLAATLVADMRSLPIASDRVGGVLAFYSLIHIPRAQLDGVLGEFLRVLRPGGRVLLSAHEGQGEVVVDEFLGQPAPVAATFFELDELVRASQAAGFVVMLAERRHPYPSESDTVRLYVEAKRPEDIA
jgi:ubiquinone/menaquinone biosynthesis C-methylase UbiE